MCTSSDATSARERIVDEWGFSSMSWTGPWVTISPRATKAIGALIDHRSRRPATSDQMTTHVDTTTRENVSRPCCTGPSLSDPAHPSPIGGPT